MNYGQFFNFLRRIQTPSVKALQHTDSCTLTSIPESFLELLRDVVIFMDKHREKFCQADEIIGIFGMQVASFRIQSSLPLQLNRIADRDYPLSHFCCTLNYLVFPSRLLHALNSWQGYHSVLIDFTTGRIMDSNHYLYLVGCRKEAGEIYGKLNEKILVERWKQSSEAFLT